jgi:hypothetical protein
MYRATATVIGAGVPTPFECVDIRIPTPKPNRILGFIAKELNVP